MIVGRLHLFSWETNNNQDIQRLVRNVRTATLNSEKQTSHKKNFPYRRKADLFTQRSRWRGRLFAKTSARCDFLLILGNESVSGEWRPQHRNTKASDATHRKDDEASNGSEIEVNTIQDEKSRLKLSSLRAATPLAKTSKTLRHAALRRPYLAVKRGQAGISRHVLFIGGRRRLARRSARQAAERKVKNRITANVNNKMEAHEDIFA